MKVLLLEDISGAAATTFAEAGCEGESVKGALTEAEYDINWPCTSDLLRDLHDVPPTIRMRTAPF